MGITGRPKSQNPKKVMATVRITERERDLLILGHKTVNGGLRAALDAMLNKPLRGEPTASAEEEPERIGAIFPPRGGWTEPITEDSPSLIVDAFDHPAGRGKKAHIHRPAVLVSSEHVRGELMETWSCECGHVLPARKAK